MARKPAKKSRSTTKRKPAKRTTKSASRKTTAKRGAKKKTTTTKKKASASRAKPKTGARTKKAVEKPTVAKTRKLTAPRNSNTKSYTQGEFFENLRGFCGLEKRSEAKELWNDISDFMQASLKKGYKVPLAGLGKMYVRRSKARMGRNPATGEPIHIPAKKRIRFTVAKALKEAVL